MLSIYENFYSIIKKISIKSSDNKLENLKILTWNMKWDAENPKQNIDHLIEIIRVHQPDIIAIQEVIPELVEEEFHITFSYNKYKNIDNKREGKKYVNNKTGQNYELEYNLQGPEYTFIYYNPKLNFKNIFRSDFNISDRNSYDTLEVYDRTKHTSSSMNTYKRGRPFTIIEFEDFTFVNVHLPQPGATITKDNLTLLENTLNNTKYKIYKYNKENNNNVLYYKVDISEYFNNKNIIIAGDLNTEYAKEITINGKKIKKINYTGNSCNGRQIDHILTTYDVKEQGLLLDKKNSDHCPLIAKISINK